MDVNITQHIVYGNEILTRVSTNVYQYVTEVDFVKKWELYQMTCLAKGI